MARKDEENFSRAYVKVCDVFINNMNPRFPATKNQPQAIERMVVDQGQKLFKIGESIILDGLNPSDPPILHFDPNNKQYTVLEGNRRFSVLKILENPALAHCRPKVEEQFKKIRDAYLHNPYEEVYCIVYENKALANKWIEIKHTTDNQGISTERWQPLQQGRYEVNTLGEKPKPTAKILDLLYENDNFPDALREKLELVPFTNLKRLIDDPKVRGFMGFSIQMGVVSEIKSKEDVAKIMQMVIEDLLGGTTVSSIYNVDDREKYLKSIKKRLGIEEPDSDDSVNKDNSKSNGTEEGTSSSSEGNKNPGNKQQGDGDSESKGSKPSDEYDNPGKPRGVNSRTRKKLKTKGQLKPAFQNNKADALYKELIGITDCSRNRILVACGIRSLIEISCEIFLAKYGRSRDKMISNNLIEVKQILESVFTNNKKEFMFIQLGNDKEVAEIAILNGYVHHKGQMPTIEGLFAIWDNYIPVLDFMWLAISKK